MLEDADGSQLCISVTTGKVAVLFCRQQICTGVDTCHERRLAVKQVTGCMNDNVGQQILHVTGQRVSPSGKQPSVARVEAAEGALVKQ